MAPGVTRKPNVVDARQKLQGKLKFDAVSKPGLKMQQRQKEQKQKAQDRKRSLDFSNGCLMVTTREEIRSATVSGGSIQVIAKVGGGRGRVKDLSALSPPEKSLRASTPMAANLAATTKNPNWRKHIPENLDISAIFSPFSDTDDDLAVDELEGRLSRGSYRPKAVPQTSQALVVTKISVTNLHPSVSRQDIEELFGVLGPLKGLQADSPRDCRGDIYQQARCVDCTCPV